MRVQIKGIDAANKNATDALSMLQTADGYLSEVNNLIKNFKALAVQAANSIYSDAERQFSNFAIREIVAEIDRISSHAEFNGLKLLTGNYSRPTADSVPLMSLWFHIGHNAAKDSNAIRAYINTFNSTALQINEISLSNPTLALDALQKVDLALSAVAQRRNDLASYQARLDSIITTTSIAKENAIASESVIRDTDIAEEVSELTKNLIVNQANIAMIAQANAQLQTVLALLG
ncbi:flagellar filament 33 kDa core protein-like [Ylistrum balloti]|uniref:flagellar filament 33 kDa core protein-like n=1 Tax=Ylistrum balloti TaxID=509963 RepID=UPI002905D3A4|nr:flagellar filament 33 kDa core protein-like [Ylistrum balloti]